MTIEELKDRREEIDSLRRKLADEITVINEQIRTLSANSLYSEFYDWAHKHSGQLMCLDTFKGTHIGTLDSTVHTDSVDGEPYVGLINPIVMLNTDIRDKASLHTCETPMDFWAEDFNPQTWRPISIEEANAMFHSYAINHFTLKP